MTRDENNLVRADESLDDLILGGLKVIQPRQGYRFSLDAVLLAHFPLMEEVELVVDLGTGSGVIPLIMAHRSASARIVGIEIQEEMAKRARRSILYNNLSDRINIIEGDIKNIDQYLPGACAQLVVSNPPFWKKGQGHISKNPDEAIARHELKVELEDICVAAAYLLKSGGHFCLIHRAERLAEIIEAMSYHRLPVRRIRAIHSFSQENAGLILVEGKKNGRSGVRLLPPLIVYEQPGVYSPEINCWYGRSQDA